MKKIFVVLFVVFLLTPAFVFISGVVRMEQVPDDGNPLTEDDPVRLAHRDAVNEECIGDVKAAPDILYCEQMADLTIAYYTDSGITQEVLHFGTFGLVPRYFHEATPLEEMEVRVRAEQLALDEGADGSERFTGEKLAEYEAKLDKFYEESDVFLSVKQRCDPNGETMKAIQGARPGVSIEELHKGMDCENWDQR